MEKTRLISVYQCIYIYNIFMNLLNYIQKLLNLFTIHSALMMLLS